MPCLLLPFSSFLLNVASLAATPFGRHLRLYGSRDGECVHDWGGHTAAIRSLAWSQDGGVVGTSSLDCTARLWIVKK